MTRQQVSTRCFAALILLGSLTGPAWAQPPAKTFDQVPARIRVGDTVYVTGPDGVERKGTLWELSSSSLAVLVNGERRELPADSVRTISMRENDSLRNGALIGLGIGVGFAALGSTYCGTGYFRCLWWSGLVYGGLGAGLGVGIDAMTPGRKLVVYSRASRSPSAQVSVSPVVSPKGQGIVLRVSF